MTAGIQPDPSFASYLRDISGAVSGDEVECPTFVDASLGARLALKDPNLSVTQVTKVVAGEPLLSARVVAYANSAAIHRGGKPVTDVKTAVMRIGLNAVRNIAVALALRQVGHAKELEPFRPQAREILEHGQEVAVLGHVLALHHGKVAPDDALFAGLVHDLGHFYALWRASQFPALVAHPQEVRSLAHDHHAAVGAALLRSLKLGDPIILAVREHEDDPALLAPGSLSQILCLANRCANNPAAQGGHTSPTPAQDGPATEGSLDEPAAHALLAEHFDEVIWLLAAIKG
jgi:HD-like signal output (HDOD) protein